MTNYREKVAASIDHTNLTATATFADIERLCGEAVAYGFAAVCVSPCYVKLAARLLRDNPSVQVATVTGFPLGTSTSSTKAFEAEEAVENGASEVDMVINIAALQEGRAAYVEEEIIQVKRSIGKKILKVILETSLLSEEQIIKGTLLTAAAGADMVKTSTGFSSRGATIADVKLFKKAVSSMPVKASGGIRDANFALALLSAGASRLGTSNAVKIMSELSSGN